MLDFVPFTSFARGTNLETDKSSTTAAKAKRVGHERERESGSRREGERGGLQQLRPDDAKAGRQWGERQGLSSVRRGPDRTLPPIAFVSFLPT